LADAATTSVILDLVQQAFHYKQLKKGANEGMSAPPLPSRAPLSPEREKEREILRATDNARLMLDSW